MDVTAGEALDRAANGNDGSAVDEAETFLRVELGAGTIPAKEVQKAASNAGPSCALPSGCLPIGHAALFPAFGSRQGILEERLSVKSEGGSGLWPNDMTEHRKLKRPAWSLNAKSSAALVV